MNTDPEIAKLDFNGKENTDLIIEALSGTNDGYVDGAPAAEACVNYVFPNGQTGYLGALGEWFTVMTNQTIVEEALAICGGNSDLSLGFHTSTQHTTTTFWKIDTARN